ncbi:MAG: VIT domain-containing protein [Planctomycetota bacterium]
MTLIPSLLSRRRCLLGSLLLTVLALVIGLALHSVGDDREPLSADSSLGKVVDREGNGVLKPVTGDRWAVAEENMLLMAGDWVKTGTRGANALQLKMKNGAVYTLGPDTLVELTDGGTLKVDRGEVEIAAPEKVTVAVQGPAGATLSATGRKVVRARDEKIAFLEADPRWLTGYKNNASTEALGSLLANVDGRNVPLTMGYHKVIVDIRDQIARTDIEESFVNHTSSVLEGVFYFPLPQDASISGFGMWIGNEYVHGEIVEKERAREIYETILREKRDPGLLEWTGGNIFKARVYPIGAEKRIRITYTQVLPKVGNTYRYNYALQSEMLRLHPLSQLKIEVKIHSAEALASIESPSHACRIRREEHSASVEFDEEEHTPTRDFELRIGTKPTDKRITLIPHRRGDDGYFMLLVGAPGAGEKENRPLLTDGKPLNLLVVADTSGSMMGPQRDTQIAFLEALLGSLGNKDRFNLVTSDVETRWAFMEFAENTEVNRATALAFLEKRAPLGWSDLDGTFAEVIRRVPADGHVVFVGDGLPTSGDADPVAFSQRLQKMYAGAGTFHAVAPGSSYESVVLRAMASLGGGSVREIGGGTDPAQTAFQLLREITTPAVKNLRVRFNNMAAAAVYPDPLPNLPAGSQQIVIGRYNPAGGAARGSVTISGMSDGKAVEYSADVELPAAEAGNSFIPRLWARHHLDYLLAQGSTAQVKERIIALSEDYQIITPYTSFLVLESDADRERFQVKKTFRMRDGEEFFAEGRDNANFDLVRKQMLVAKSWRKRIRDSVMARLAEMDRDQTHSLLAGPQLELAYEGGVYDYLGAGGGYKDRTRDVFERRGLIESEESLVSNDDKNAPGSEAEPDGRDEPMGEEDNEVYGPSPSASPVEEKAKKSSELKADYDEYSPRRENAQGGKFYGLRARGGKDARVGGVYAGERSAFAGRRGDRGGPYDYLNALFPAVPGPRGKMAEPAWSKEVLDLVRKMDRRAWIAASAKGLHFTLKSSGVDSRGRKHEYGTHEDWISAATWLTITTHLAGLDYQVQWLTAEERGVLSAAWLLGRTRKPEDGDAASWEAPFGWYFFDTFAAYAGASVAMETLADGRISLVFTWPAQPAAQTVVILDPAKSAVLEVRGVVDNEVVSTTLFSDLVEVGGAWWPAKIVTKDKAGKETSTLRIEVQELARADLDAAVAKVLERKNDAILLGKAPEKLEDAKQAFKDGKATIEDIWAVLGWASARQNWDDAKPAMQAFAERLKGKAGLTPIRLALLQQSRQNEELKALLQEAIAALAATPRDADFSAAWHVINYANSLNAGNETMALLETLKPVCERQKEIFEPLLPWDRQWLYALQNMGQAEQFFAAQRTLAEKYPFQVDLQNAVANTLSGRGEVDAALAFLAQAESKNGPWQDYEIDQLRQTGGWILFNSYRLDAFVSYVEGWDQAHPGKVPQQSWDMFLSALIMLDREPQASKRIEEWLVSFRKEKLSPGEIVRVSAAIRHAMGQGYNLWNNRFDERMSAALAETALYFADHKTLSYLTGQILQGGSFLATDEARAVRNTLYGRLKTQTASLPAAKVAEFVAWLKPYGFVTDEGEAGWQKILDAVYERWLVEAAAQDKQVLAQVVLGYGRGELRLKCLRKTLQDAKTPAETAAALENLFSALLAEPWKAEIQAELLTLLPRLTAAPGETKPEEVILAIRVVGLHLLVDWMTAARADATVAALPGVNELPRRKVKEARQKALKEARGLTVGTLADLEKSAGLETLRPWLAMERVYQQVKLGGDIKPLETEVRALLASVMEATAKKKTDDVTLAERILAERCVSTLSWLAVRAAGEPGAPAVSAILATMNEAIAGNNELIEWRGAKFELLTALDRGDDLEAALKEWYGEKREFAKLRWGKDLATVEAERGRVQDAVTVFEELRKLGELDAEELKTLSDWYTVLDSRDKSREARILSWQARNEWEISNWLQSESYRYQRSGPDVPSEMDAEVPLAFIALFRKASYPANYAWTLQSFYQSTRDFRLLECIPEAVIGQSSQQIYPLLNALKSVTDSIQEEATLDRLEKHLQAQHGRSNHDVNRRALRLLEFMVEHRAAEQTHGVGPHADAALAALKEAFKLSWADGEPVMMAEFLANRGGMKPAALAEEQLRELGVLYGGAPAGSEVRFAIGGHMATAQWANGRQQAAIVTLGGALGEHRAANKGQLPQSANPQLGTYSSWLQVLGDFRAAEKVWLDELAGKPNEQQALWLKQSLFLVYQSALARRAEVSLGKGPGLYAAMFKAIVEEMQSNSNENHLSNLVSTLANTWHNVHHDLKYPGVGADVSRFAFELLPPMLNRYNYRNSQGIISTVAERLREIVSALSALEFLVVRAETEPGWLRLQHQGFWSNLGHLASRYRVEAKSLPAQLSARLLTLVLRELKEDLRSMSARNRSMYSIGSGEFWSEKQPDFSKAAHEVLAQYERSEARVLYIADYLYHDLRQYADAIEALLSAHRRQLLGLNGQYKLCEFLQQQNRDAEAIPILIPMIAKAPDALAYRVLLMRAYFKTKNEALLLQTLAQADTHFHKDARWTENVMATLGGICLETCLFKQCIGYYDEAIALHVKTAPNRGVGDGVLSVYYRNEAGAWSGLGETDKAVDSAAGAILSWGRHVHGRQDELARLSQVLREAKDLDAYVKRLDAVIKETGLENPIVRKALGQVYFEKSRYEQAATQLQQAVEVQPNDVETHRLLIDAWDRMGARDRATAQLLESAKLTGHNVELYKDLGKRWTEMNQPANAERAFTNLVEMMPQESESHQALADVRRAQSRWAEEALQWRHVIRIRSREPGGYLGLAQALISWGKKAEAREVLEKAVSTDWPARFESERNKARDMLQQIGR